LSIAVLLAGGNRWSVRYALSAVLFVLGYGAVSGVAAELNVLLILVDDLRPALGCYGDPLAKTPQIDRFATTARRFDRAYCQQAVCGPSRTALLTGRLPDHTTVWHNRNSFRTVQPDLITLPQLFRLHGWHCVSLGKVFSGDARELDPISWSVPEVLRKPEWKSAVLRADLQRGKGQPFECADVADEVYADGGLATAAVEQLRHSASGQQPFFLAVGFFKPHLPFNAPARYWDLHRREDFLSADPTARPVNAPELAFADHLELAGYRDVPSDERVGAATAAELRHGYYACVSYVDAQIGRLLQGLEDLRLQDSTIVVLLGDHGYGLGEAGRWCKDTNFELDTRIPLLLRVPGQRYPGKETRGLLESVDLYPTLAELAGLQASGPLDGRSFAAAVFDPEAPGREVALSQFSRPFRSGTPQVMGYSIRSDAQRYTRWIDWATKGQLAEELYDYAGVESSQQLSGGLVEHTNLAGLPGWSEVRRQMSERLDLELSERVRPLALPESAEPGRRRRKGAVLE